MFFTCTTNHSLTSTFVYFIELFYSTQIGNTTMSSDSNLSLQKIKIKIKIDICLAVLGALLVMLLLLKMLLVDL